MLNAQSDEQNDEVYELLSQWDGRAPIDGLTAMVSAVRIDLNGSNELIGDTNLATFMSLSPENQELVYKNAEAVGITFNAATDAAAAFQIYR